METPFKLDLAKQFTDKKKLAPTSIKLYLRNLEKLNNNESLKNFNFLKDPTAIVKKLEKYAENTKRGYLISVTSALSLDTTTKPKKALYDQYFALMMEMNKKLKAEESNNEMSDKQKENWLTQDEVQAKFNELETKVKAFPKGAISSANYDTLLGLQVLALYTCLPPRRNEYQNLNLVKTGTSTLPTDTNYLDYDARKFVFNKFKTSKKDGKVELGIPENLFTVINLYLKHHPLLKGKKLVKTTNIPFLVYYNGEPLNKVNSITRILNKVFGKSVGSSMLRHIYLSSKYGAVQEEQKKDSEAMSHSLGQQKDYIKV